MRKLAWLIVGVTLGATVAPAQAADFPSEFATPSRDVQPKFRWWWPNASWTTPRSRRELDQMADAGFGGAEIADVHHSAKQPLDPAGHGWGTAAWSRRSRPRSRGRSARDDGRPDRGPVVAVGGPEHHARQPAAIKELA